MIQKVSASLHKRLYGRGSLGEMGVSIFKLGLNVSTNLKRCKFVTGPRQFDSLNFRVMGETGPHKTIAELRQPELAIFLGKLKIHVPGGTSGRQLGKSCTFLVLLPLGKERGQHVTRSLG